MDLTWIDRALGSDIPYITYAVPVFFLLIGIELVAAIWAQKKAYRLHDSINDLSCGITEQMVGLFLKGLLLAGYLGTYAYARRRGINVVDVQSYSASGKWVAAIVLFLGVDCAYYWFHRIAHEYNAPWAGHVVHHSSEDYNLAVALRQGTFQGVFSWVFYLPLALLGYPPAWFAAMSSFDTLYQFWIHTRLIGKLGPLEWVLNTPSHHRVHHGRNPKYLDKNYAGTLIVWDRLFGTFKAEEEEPVYGLTKPLESWNPLWANFHVWRDLCRDAWLAPRWVDKLRIWFMPQGWRPAGLPANPVAAEVTRQTFIPYDTTVSRGLNAYAFVNFVVALLLAIGALANGKSMAGRELVALALLVLWALLDIGGIFERRAWALRSELLRLPVTAVVLAIGLPDGPWHLHAQACLAVSVAGLVLWLLWNRGELGGDALGGIRQPRAPLNYQAETTASNHV
jgi:alkylglycerol monooxygenase